MPRKPRVFIEGGIYLPCVSRRGWRRTPEASAAERRLSDSDFAQRLRDLEEVLPIDGSALKL